jgi:hypothetical protein
VDPTLAKPLGEQKSLSSFLPRKIQHWLVKKKKRNLNIKAKFEKQEKIQYHKFVAKNHNYLSNQAAFL